MSVHSIVAPNVYCWYCMEQHPQLQAQQHLVKDRIVKPFCSKYFKQKVQFRHLQDWQNYVSWHWRKSLMHYSSKYLKKRISRWCPSAGHMLTATAKPTRHFTSEIEYNFVSNMFQQLQLQKRQDSLLIQVQILPTTGFFPNFPGCQNDLYKDDASSRSSLSIEYTCSGVGIGDYLPISTLACYKSQT